MIQRTCFLLAAWSSIAWGNSADYLDTAFGWQAGYLPRLEEPGSLRQGIKPQEHLATRYPGVATAQELLQEMEKQAREFVPHGSWIWFPSTPQRFAPYLDSIFVPGNSCAEPCAWITQDALSTSAQQMKAMLSRIGLQYQITTSCNYTGTPSQHHHKRQNFTSFNSQASGKWFIGKSSDNSQGLFLSFEADWGEGIHFNERHGGVANSIGSLSQPQGSLRGGNGVFLPELALGYSAWNGKWVGMIGTLDVSNYLDQNAYAASWNGNLTNSAFGSNPCLPMQWGNWGYMTAWQPCDSFYAMYATAGTNGGINRNPFKYINANYWAHIGELGYINPNVAGMGAGIYRFQYTISRNNGHTGDGLAFNIQQQLGRQSRLGFFSRCGYIDRSAGISGIRATATAGLVLQAPFRSHGWGSRSNHDQVALGFLWLRPDGAEATYQNKNEYGLELTAVVQLTPTFFLQPDIQCIFNPIHGEEDCAVVMQIQGVFRF